jgi:hypothetical protein
MLNKAFQIKHNPSQVNLCKLALKSKGLDDAKIELLENNIRAIINNVLNTMKYE